MAPIPHSFHESFCLVSMYYLNILSLNDTDTNAIKCDIYKRKNAKEVFASIFNMRLCVCLVRYLIIKDDVRKTINPKGHGINH